MHDRLKAALPGADPDDIAAWKAASFTFVGGLEAMQTWMRKREVERRRLLGVLVARCKNV